MKIKAWAKEPYRGLVGDKVINVETRDRKWRFHWRAKKYGHY